MKKTILILLAVILLMLCACAAPANDPSGSQSEKDTGANVSSETDRQTEPNPETDPGSETEKGLENGVYLLINGKCYYKVVYPLSFSKNYELSLVESFKQEFLKVTGAEIGSKTDKSAPTEKGMELLLGPTNREVSQTLLAHLEEAGGSRYGYLVSGTKIAVCGTNIYMTYLGLQHILEENVLTDASGKLNVGFEDGSEWISEEMAAIPDYAEATANNVRLAYYFDGYAVSVPSLAPMVNGEVRMFAIMQGGCTDGRYVYVAMGNQKDGVVAYVKLFKYDLETWEEVAVSDPIVVGHANGITYDSVNNRLVFSDSTDETGYRGIYFVDPDSLTVTGSMTIDAENSSIVYLPDRDGYVCIVGTGPNNEFCTLTYTDASFNVLHTFTIDMVPGVANQGSSADEKYVYGAKWYNQEVERQYVQATDLDGTVAYPISNVYDIPEVPNEAEFIFKYGDVFYMGLQGDGDKVGRLLLLPEGWFSADGE